MTVATLTTTYKCAPSALGRPHAPQSHSSICSFWADRVANHPTRLYCDGGVDASGQGSGSGATAPLPPTLESRVAVRAHRSARRAFDRARQARRRRRSQGAWFASLDSASAAAVSPVDGREGDAKAGSYGGASRAAAALKLGLFGPITGAGGAGAQRLRLFVRDLVTSGRGARRISNPIRWPA